MIPVGGSCEEEPCGRRSSPLVVNIRGVSDRRKPRRLRVNTRNDALPVAVLGWISQEPCAHYAHRQDMTLRRPRISRKSVFPRAHQSRWEDGGNLPRSRIWRWELGEIQFRVCIPRAWDPTWDADSRTIAARGDRFFRKPVKFD